MKKLLLATAATLLIAAPAFAADLPARVGAVAPAPVFVTMNWTGFYVGAQVGYSWGTDRTTEFVTATGAATGFARGFSPDGFVGGLHAGYNYQMGSLVLGLEGDIEASGVSGGYRLANGNGTDTDRAWQGSLRARVGVAFDRALLYATGGVAFADIKHTYVSPAVRESFSDVKMGWTVGAGLEYAFTNNLTARAEYRYTSFDRFGHNSVSTLR